MPAGVRDDRPTKLQQTETGRDRLRPSQCSINGLRLTSPNVVAITTIILDQ